MFMIFGLTFVCFVSPYEVSFIETPLDAEFLRRGADPLFWMNRLVDVMFIVDMILQFFVMYPVSRRYITVYCQDHRLVVKHYLRTWFTVDCMSVLPFDVIALIAGANGISQLKIVRVVRLLRLLKLAHLVRGLQMLRRYELELSFSYRKMTLYRLLVVVIVSAHWFGCFLGIMSKIQGDICVGPDEPPGCVETWFSAEAAVLTERGSELTAFRFYLVGLHTAATLIVHPHAFRPTGEGEIISFTVLTFVGGFLWTRVISRTTAVATSMDRHSINSRQDMDDLNAIAAEFQLPHDLKKQLRAFFLHTRDRSKRHTWHELVERMSPSLKTEVCFQINRAWLRRVPYLCKVPRIFISQIAVRMKSEHYSQEETFGHTFTLYIVNRGLCTRGAAQLQVLQPGAVWGEEHLLLTAYWLLVPNTAKTFTFVEVSSLSKSSFEEACNEIPEVKAKMRQYLVWYAMIRGIIYEARKLRQEQLREQGKATMVTILSADHNIDHEHAHHARRAIREAKRTLSGNVAELRPPTLLINEKLTPSQTEISLEDDMQRVAKADRVKSCEQESPGGTRGRGLSEDDRGGPALESRLVSRLEEHLLPRLDRLDERTARLETLLASELAQLRKAVDGGDSSSRWLRLPDEDAPLAPIVPAAPHPTSSCGCLPMSVRTTAAVRVSSPG